MYQIYIQKRARKSLLKITGKDQKRIINSIQSLKDDPYPSTSKKLIGREAWRIRMGNYRIIYEVFEKNLIIDVVDLGHRKDIYRQ